MYWSSRLVRGVASRRALGALRLGVGPVRLIAITRLATDAPDEGSGSVRGGRSRLQHMSGSRGWRVFLGTVAEFVRRCSGEPV